MAKLFICSQCGKPHTEQEYEDSRFCRECGKFISYRDRSIIPDLELRRKKVKHDKLGLFPYEPYPQQIEFMEDVKKVVGNRGVLIAEACNGFGKTVCALASILPMDRKVVYATRTHEQIRQVLVEVERINRNSSRSFSAVNLASRQHLCLNDKCRNLTGIEAQEACRMLKDTGRCSFKTDFEISSSVLPRVLAINELRRQGRARGFCPYLLARRAAENYTVIVTPYQYIFNEHIRRRVKLTLKGKVLIFDEAHNADQIGQATLSDTLSERTLDNARRELETVETSAAFIDNLTSYLDEKTTEIAVVEPGSQLRKDLKQVLDVEKLSSFASNFSDVVEEIRSHKILEGEYPSCFLNGVLNFLEHVDRSPELCYVTIYRRSRQGFNFIEYRCLDPSLAVKPVMEEASGALFMSGTLSPLELYANLMGLEDSEKRTYSAIANPENVRTIIVPSVTTKFTERSKGMIRHYGEKVSRIVNKIPNGVLVFFTQRKLMLDSLKHWQRGGIIKQSKRGFSLAGKLMFIEGNRAGENRRIVEEYKRCAKSGKGAVLCGVFRGRNAEGSNFPHEEARGIILIGVPYADYTDPVVKSQIRYFNGKRKGMGESWYVMDAFRAANQALGRGIRHRDDWCNFILMDSRYGNRLEFISNWAVSNGIHKIN